jgi:ATP-dependent DNA helicase DinG
MPTVAERFSTRAARAVRDAIADAGGNEVFLLGTLSDGRVDDVRVLARGHRQAVPALLQVPRPGEVVIHNHPSGTLHPSDADIEVSSALGNHGVASYIIDNEVARLYVVVEPLDDVPEEKLEEIAVARVLGPKGRVAQALSGYEHRPQQLEMLGAVVRAFNDREVLTVEAGTGTGKSLAYLVPAILWARANQERVVVSTHTINLQEQLVKKDLPFLMQKAGLECRAILVKGRGNYLCQRKTAQAEEQIGTLVEDDVARELREIFAWAKQTKDGSLADLAVRPRWEVWEHVVSENDNCLRARCPYYSTCFFYTARRAAATADVLVVNHHLLMADLALREQLDDYTQNAVLPPATRIIIDEAHHLEDVATAYFGSRVSPVMMERVFSRLQGRNQAKGILPALTLALESLDRGDDRMAAEGAVRWIDQRLLPRRASLALEVAEIFSRLLAAYERLPRPATESNVEQKLRVTAEVREGEFWRLLAADLGGLAAALDAYAVDFDGVLDRVAQLSDAVPPQVRYLATELRAQQGRLSAMAAALLELTGDDDELCRWLEYRARGRSGPTLSLHSAPIDVAPRLRAALFDRFPTSVLTSATLAVGGSFDHLHQRVGIDRLETPERNRGLRIDSPFDFAAQALLVVPRDLPEPTEPDYEPATHEAIRLCLNITRGGTFVLFTAYGALNRAFSALEAELRAGGLNPLRQGEMSRHVLLQQFVHTPASVLFATDSFWEGVDVKGDALRCVVIARLPFKVPTEPIEAARVEAIEARGGNPFNEHTLPQAVIKLKQGFGRLIRSRDDRGCVVVLDSRIARKRYGSVFLASLPPARRVIAPAREAFEQMRRFFRNPRSRSTPP